MNISILFKKLIGWRKCGLLSSDVRYNGTGFASDSRRGLVRLSTLLKSTLGVILLASGVVFDVRAESFGTDPALVGADVLIDSFDAYAPSERQFQGIPGLACAPGGRLWAVWYAGGRGEGPENYVMGVTSGDDGDTWSEPKFVIDPPGDVRAYDPVPWVDPQGRLWIFYAQSFRWWDGRAGVWAIMTDHPDIPNPRWSKPRRLMDGIMMNKPTVLANGDWLFPVSIWSREPEKESSKQRFVPDPHRKWSADKVGAHVYRSGDQGKSFSRLGSVKIVDPVFDEHMIVERRDGSLWLLARNLTGMAESFSTDGGQTWTESKQATIPHINSRFFIRRLQSGRLLLVKHNPRLDTNWLAGRGSQASWLQRSHLTAYLSEDDGKSWYGGLILDSRIPVSYPDGDQAADGRIFIIYDFNRHTDKEIYLARFTEEDVKAGQFQSAGARTSILIDKAMGAP